MSTYSAFVATPEVLDEFKKIDWNTEEGPPSFFDAIEEMGFKRIWNNDCDGWVLTAITEWVDQKLKLRPVGSELGSELMKGCDFVHWALAAEDKKEIYKRLEKIDPYEDLAFAQFITEYFENLGDDYVDGYLGEGLQEFFDTFENLRSDLNTESDKALVVIIPF